MEDIKNCGIFNLDYLGHIELDTKSGNLYVFNYGNFGRTYKFLHGIDENDYTDIEDWLSNLMTDYGHDYYIDVISHKLITLEEVPERFITEKLNELGREVLLVAFKHKPYDIS